MLLAMTTTQDATSLESSTNGATRRVSDMSGSATEKVENPFMALVDAATMLASSPSKTEVEPGTKADLIGRASGSQEMSSGVGSVIQGTKDDLFGDPSKKITFAEQLMDILDNPENNDVISWMPEGDSFTIVDHKKFTLNKMPKLFNIRNMSSFVRKLGRWGFNRVHEKETRNSDIFKHPHFVRGNRDLCKKKVKCIGRIVSVNQENPGAPDGANLAQGHMMDRRFAPGMGGPAFRGVPVASPPRPAHMMRPGTGPAPMYMRAIPRSPGMMGQGGPAAMNGVGQSPRMAMARRMQGVYQDDMAFEQQLIDRNLRRMAAARGMGMPSERELAIRRLLMEEQAAHEQQFLEQRFIEGRMGRMPPSMGRPS